MAEGRRINALVLAAGLGTRLKPLTDTTPKCLIEVGGRPLLAHWVDALRAVGAREALVNTHHHPEQVRAFAEEASAGGFTLRTFHEETLLGSAGTIARNADLADGADAVLVIYADNYSDVDLARFLQTHFDAGRPATMLLFRAPDPKQAGIVELDEAGCVASFVEKPERPASDLANAGVYAFTPDAYGEVAAMGAFDLGFDVLPRFVGRMTGALHEGAHQDIGTPERLAAARREAEAAGAGRTG